MSSNRDKAKALITVSIFRRGNIVGESFPICFTDSFKRLQRVIQRFRRLKIPEGFCLFYDFKLNVAYQLRALDGIFSLMWVSMGLSLKISLSLRAYLKQVWNYLGVKILLFCVNPTSL